MRDYQPMEITLQLIYVIVPIVIGWLALGVKSQLTKIDNLTIKQQEFVTKDEVNSLINERLQPIKDDINEIKQTLTKLYDFLLRK